MDGIQEIKNYEHFMKKLNRLSKNRNSGDLCYSIFHPIFFDNHDPDFILEINDKITRQKRIPQIDYNESF